MEKDIGKKGGKITMVNDLQIKPKTQLQTDDLLYDMIFKHIFLDHPDILIGLIKDAIGYDFNLDRDKVRVLNELLPKEKFMDKNRFVDTLLLAKGKDIFNIEVNRNDFNPKKVERMVKYLNRLYDRSHIIQNLFGIKEDEELRFIQVHLNAGVDKTGKIVTKYNLRADDKRDDILIKNYEIYVINVDNSYKMIENDWKKRYNECSKGLLLVSVFHSDSVKEIEELMIKGGLKKDMAKKLTDTINSKLNSEEFLDMLFEVRDSEKERQDALEYKLEQGFEQGIEKGIEQGIEKGIEQGIEQGREEGLKQGVLQERNNNLKGMLENGIDESIIKKILGVSKPEITAMKKTLSL